MIVLRTQGAQEDLVAILEYIAKDSLGAAKRVTERIFNSAQSLSTFPRPTRARN